MIVQDAEQGQESMAVPQVPVMPLPGMPGADQVLAQSPPACHHTTACLQLYQLETHRRIVTCSAGADCTAAFEYPLLRRL